MADVISPSRAAVLRAAAKGRVWEAWHGDQPGNAQQQTSLLTEDRTVTSEVRWLKQHGWAETDPGDAGLHERRIRPTDAGRQWLAQHADEG